MIDSVKEFIYNLIHYHLIKGGYKVSPLSYTNESCSFSIYDLDYFKTPVITNELLDLLQNIKQVEILYSYEDFNCIYLDQEPTLNQQVFQYNPYNECLKYTLESKEHIKEMINTLVGNKKSRSLKYYFKNRE